LLFWPLARRALAANSDSTDDGSARTLKEEIAEFFRTGIPPVNPEETQEMMAFIEAAEISKARGGASVPISEVTR